MAPDPSDDPEEEVSRPLLGPLFWVLIGFGLLCVLGGLAVALLAPRLFPPPS